MSGFLIQNGGPEIELLIWSSCWNDSEILWKLSSREYCYKIWICVMQIRTSWFLSFSVSLFFFKSIQIVLVDLLEFGLVVHDIGYHNLICLPTADSDILCAMWSLKFTARGSLAWVFWFLENIRNKHKRKHIACAFDPFHLEN